MLRLGLVIDCPTCLKTPHKIEIPLHRAERWGMLPIYRYSGYDMTDLSISPSIVGTVLNRGCNFKGWVRLGRVEYDDLETRPVRRWENVDTTQK